jgi:guanine deaminase
MKTGLHAIRGSFFDFIDDPWKHVGCEQNSARFYADGMLVLDGGYIKAFGDYSQLSAQYSSIEMTHIPGRLILPGFIDGHIHMAQTRVIGAFGQQLLGWLQQWVFPEEKKYSDPVYAKQGAKRFFDNLVAAGTTTCQAFLTHDAVCTEAFFEEASNRNMLVIGGLTGIDRFAPEGSMDSAENFYRDSKSLIGKYHRKGRNLYAITPRFALGCTAEMMSVCEKLHNENPDVWINTHISETPTETHEVCDFHGTSDYLEAYEKYNLVGAKFTGAHGVWLSDGEFSRLSKSGAAVAFCPVSNLFLGSGFFRLGRATDPANRVRIVFGTDIGGGNRFSMINVLDEAYKIGMCNNSVLDGGIDPRLRNSAEAERNKLSAYRAFWSATLGGAEALYLDDRVGNFEPGKEADFVVLDWNAGPQAMGWREELLVGQDGPQTVTEAANLLFSIMAIGDDRNVDETWIMGQRLYKKRSTETALVAR